MKFLFDNILSFTCFAAMCIMGLLLYPGLPESIPTQYNFDGVAGNYLPKLAVVLITPIMYGASIAVVNLMIHYSPSKFSMPNSQRTMDIIIFAVGVLLLSTYWGILASDGNSDIFQQYFAIGFAFLLIVMGNVIGKTERNFIAGIRIPWTIASEQNWRATHRFAGKLMVASGLLLLLSSFFLASLVLTLSLSLCWLLISSIYSFMFFLKNERPTSE